MLTEGLKNGVFVRYLHHEADPRIIHRDIKASNVLLDSDFNPLVADFGFAKLIPDGVSHMTTRVKGSLGYLATEYAMWGKVSESCDVYSFGILLIEARLRPEAHRAPPGWGEADHHHRAEPLMASTSRLTEIVDPRLHGDFDVQQLRRVLHAAARAVQSEPDRRPTMNQVLDVIRGSAPAADPVKNAGRMKAACRGPLDEGGRGSTMSGSVVRLKSVNYGKELMDMDDDEEDEAEGGDDDLKGKTT
ncbi:hypothetical protein HPP92_000178 [Vanilla planifolia]|uniref:Protein kinase domain-containing protein n=1 Tax=Vanilla planifolia TaxID=51239 RepID=A0A835RXI2_VANPL|nr:hypothetical protein HPP92_000178 [Vanilla planifolia]